MATPASRVRLVMVPDVAAKLPEVDLMRIRRWCDEVPARARHQMRHEYRLRGATVTLVERRVPWDAPDTPYGPEWTAQPLVQFRHDGDLWHLWWPDRNTRWHRIEDVPPARGVAPLLEALDDPRLGLLG